MIFLLMAVRGPLWGMYGMRAGIGLGCAPARGRFAGRSLGPRRKARALGMTSVQRRRVADRRAVSSEMRASTPEAARRRISEGELTVQTRMRLPAALQRAMRRGVTSERWG